MRKTKEQFIEDAIKVHGNKYDYSKVDYQTNKDKIIVICKKHGEFLQSPNKHLLGRGCPKCCNEHKGDHAKYSLEDFMQKANKIHNNKYDYSKVNYINSKTKVCIICPEHGEFWQIPQGHLKGQNCPICGKIKNHESLRYTTEIFINKASNVHNNFYSYERTIYVQHDSKVIITCPNHGDFIQLPSNHLAGQGCPKCKLKSQSNIFTKIIKRYPNLKWDWEFSPEWLFPQRFDIYCSELNLAIEFNGRQHYESVECFGGIERFKKQQVADLNKKIKCSDNNCQLYIIKYNEINLQDLYNFINQLIENKHED